MRSKISSKWSLLLMSVISVAFSSIIISFLTDIQSVASVHPGVFQEHARLTIPVRLIIQKINVNAAVEQAGLASDGTMDVPKGPLNVAWLNLGPRPGESGSAVIAGHYGWKNGQTAAFDNLYKLRRGDELYVEDDKRVITSFIVRESRRYDPNADASPVFSSHDGKAHLNLITCEGVWDKISKSYSKRLVVFADKE